MIKQEIFVKRPRYVFENINKHIKNLKELIDVGKDIKLYNNINNVMLWRILPYLEELYELIGMESLKESIFTQVIYYLQGMHLKSPGEYLHTVIYGPPGCGKTTVAKIIGNIYTSIGILSSKKSKFKIAYRDDFIAGYLGQTALKTKNLLQSCIGGVLFIDEVYSLASSKKNDDSFSKESLDILTAFLSENKDNFCCIIAGYEDDIKECFFNTNQGLERRFPWIHRIDEYTPANLCDMFYKMVKDNNWEINCDNSIVMQLFANNSKIFKNNGGDIETFITKCKMLHAKRVFMMDESIKFKLTDEDLSSAIKYINNSMVNSDDNLYNMYA